jgi:hypothetical protein
MKRGDFLKYPMRRCQTLHTCALCEDHIVMGERYYDGGYGRRAHVDCIHSVEPVE